MNILIAGGTGLIGKKLTEQLIELNHSVFILSRKEVTGNITGIHFIKWDGREIPETGQAFDAVINLAGEPVIDKAWTKKRKQRVLGSRTGATFALVDYINAQKKKPQVFISASAVGYYGNRGSEILTEDAGPGIGFLPDVCTQWEKAALFSTVRTVMLRTGIVLAKEGGALPEMMLSYRLGFGTWFGKGDQGFPWIHIDDEIGLILFALENEKVNGPLNLSGPQLMSNKEFIKTLGKVSGKNIAFPVPAFALKLALGGRSAALLDSQFVKPQKALDLGYMFKFKDAGSALKDLMA